MRTYHHFQLPYRFYWWLIIAVLLYAFNTLYKYIYAPFKIRQSQRQPGTVSYQACEITDLPAHITPHFLRTVPPLASAGFVTQGCATRMIPETHLESYVSLWVNQKLQDTAQIITVVVRPAGGTTKVVNSTLFRTEFTDETSIITTNSGSGGVFPRDPNVAGISSPALQDIGELYRLHRARVAYHRGSRKPTIPVFKDATASLQNEHHKTFERLITARYYDYDPASDEYIPTMRGAFLMTYKMLTPFKQIQKRRKQTAAVKEMRRVGFERLAPQPAVVPPTEAAN